MNIHKQGGKSPDKMKITGAFHKVVGSVGFPSGSMVKNPLAKAGDMGSVLGSRRFSGEGNGNLLKDSCLGSPMDRRARRATVRGVATESEMTATEQQSRFYI